MRLKRRGAHACDCGAPFAQMYLRLLIAALGLTDGPARFVLVADRELLDVGVAGGGRRHEVLGAGDRVREEPRTVGLHLELGVALPQVAVARGGVPALRSARLGVGRSQREVTVLDLGGLEGRLRTAQAALPAFALLVVAAAGQALDGREAARGHRGRHLGGLRDGRADHRDGEKRGSEEPKDISTHLKNSLFRF
jgi:hypothetical protein